MRKQKIAVVLAVLVGVLAVGVRAGTGRAAVAPPAHVVMLVCSTTSVLASTSTEKLAIDPKGGCPAALKVILDAGYRIVDRSFGDEGRRVAYVAMNTNFGTGWGPVGDEVPPATDFNVSRSNKDKGLAAPADTAVVSCNLQNDRGRIVGDPFSVVEGAATNRLDLRRSANCAAALKEILDSGLWIVDVSYGEGGRTAVYTAVSAQAVSDFNRSRSNKDRG